MRAFPDSDPRVALELAVLRSVAEIEEHGETWRSLFARVPAATAFHSYEWNRGLAAREERGVALRVLVARDARGEAVGVGPLCVRPGPMPGLPTLEFVGSRHSDYCGFLVSADHRAAFGALVADWIARSREWRVASLTGLRPPTVRLLADCALLREHLSDVCPIARLPASSEAYEAWVMHPKLRENVRREKRRLGARLGFRTCAGPEETEEGLAILFDLHQRRQALRGERGRFFDRAWRDAFRELSQEMLRAGFLRLGILRIDGRPAAASYNLRSPDREVYYLGGFEPGLSRHSPGNLVQHCMILAAIADGVRVYDFGRGDERYKARWCNDSSVQIRVEGSRRRSWLALWRAQSALRRSLYASRRLKHAYRLLRPPEPVAPLEPSPLPLFGDSADPSAAGA